MSDLSLSLTPPFAVRRRALAKPDARRSPSCAYGTPTRTSMSTKIISRSSELEPRSPLTEAMRLRPLPRKRQVLQRARWTHL